MRRWGPDKVEGILPPPTRYLCTDMPGTDAVYTHKQQLQRSMHVLPCPPVYMWAAVSHDFDFCVGSQWTPLGPTLDGLGAQDKRQILKLSDIGTFPDAADPSANVEWAWSELVATLPTEVNLLGTDAPSCLKNPVFHASAFAKDMIAWTERGWMPSAADLAAVTEGINATWNPLGPRWKEPYIVAGATRAVEARPPVIHGLPPSRDMYNYDLMRTDLNFPAASTWDGHLLTDTARGAVVKRLRTVKSQ